MQGLGTGSHGQWSRPGDSGAVGGVIASVVWVHWAGRRSSTNRPVSQRDWLAIAPWRRSSECSFLRCRADLRDSNQRDNDSHQSPACADSLCRDCAISSRRCPQLARTSPCFQPNTDWQVRGKAETQLRGIGFAIRKLVCRFEQARR
jgi:hypothetical protein